MREWIATTFARSTPGLRRKSLARRHTFRSVVQAVKASLYVKRYVSLLQPLVKFCGRSNVFLFGYDSFSVWRSCRSAAVVCSTLLTAWWFDASKIFCSADVLWARLFDSAMFDLVLKWLEGGRGTNFCWPIPYKFPSFFNLPLLSKWKMALIIKLSRENTELSLAKITSKRVGLAIKIRSWLQIFLVESLTSTIWSAGYKHKIFFFFFFSR